MRKKRSIIWAIPKEELEDVVRNNNTITAILKHFNLIHKGGNSKTLKSRLVSDGIDFSHIILGMNSNKGKRFPSPSTKIDLKEILVENSTYNRCDLKKRLISDNILPKRCCICGLLPEWNGRSLSLTLDHINGVSDDNRLENLRLLCPNCHSQTDSFAGKKNRRCYECKQCKAKITRHSRTGLCSKCVSFQQRKAERPDKEIIVEQISKLGYCGTARLYGVSDSSLRKWLK
jgi:hypothetical protein